jgi:hypothetical protein
VYNKRQVSDKNTLCMVGFLQERNVQKYGVTACNNKELIVNKILDSKTSADRDDRRIAHRNWGAAEVAYYHHSPTTVSTTSTAVLSTSDSAAVVADQL